jgi:hypothetical protein
MQSATQCIPFAVPSQSSHAKPTTFRPRSFEQALRRGWKIVREVTALGADKRPRHGTVILANGGSEKLRVPYTGTIRQSYRFGRPEAA